MTLDPLRHHWWRAIRIGTNVAWCHGFILSFPSNLVLILNEFDSFSVELLFDLLKFSLYFFFLLSNVASELASKLVEGFNFPSELGSDHGGRLHGVLTASLDIWPNPQHHVNDVIEVAISCR